MSIPASGNGPMGDERFGDQTAQSLGKENAKLKKLLIEQILIKEALKEIAEKK